MFITVNSEIFIEDPDEAVINFCKKELVFPNPEVEKKARMGIWTGNIPPKINLYYKRGNTYVVPIGVLDDIWALHPVVKDYEVQFGKHTKNEFPEPKMKPYDYQEIAIEHMIKAKRGILQASCGSGKSLCAVEAIRRIGYKAIIICHTYELLSQFKTYLTEHLQLSENDIGIIAGGKLEIGDKITLASRQSLVNIDLQKYKYEWGTIIVDECHSCAANLNYVNQYTKILSNLAAEYRISLTATPFRGDGLTRCLLALCGRVKYEIPTAAVADKTIKAKVKRIDTEYEIKHDCQRTDGTLDYAKLSTSLADDSERNELILDLLEQNKDNYCLVLSDRLSGLKYLQERLGSGVMIEGNMTSKKAKKERGDNVEKIRNKEEHFLFATLQLAREGLDIKPLDRLFLIAPSRNKAVIIQSVGRIERKSEGKSTPIVYDFVDNTIYHKNMWNDRRRIYKKNGNTIL